MRKDREKKFFMHFVNTLTDDERRVVVILMDALVSIGGRDRRAVESAVLGEVAARMPWMLGRVTSRPVCEVF